MPVLAQAHDGFQQFVLCKGAVQRGYAVQLRMFPVRKHDGFRLPFKEECGMHEVDLCRHEVVGIHVGRVVYQLSERREHTDYGIGYQLFEDGPQSECSQRVLFEDGNFRCMWHG